LCMVVLVTLLYLFDFCMVL